ncbi:MAG TPA: DUF2232 domain-containing protein [Thermoanaerobaculia bacterium]|nr:DUF2232 domain-containing protein [Thermoanaerobaculia bacterium]
MIESSLHHEPVVLPERSFARTARSVAGYAVLLWLMFISPLFVFMPTAIFHCGIRNGRRVVWLALALGAGLASMVAFQTANAAGTTPAEGALGYAYLLALASAVAIPSLAVLPLVERGESFGRVLISGLLIAIAGLAGTEVIVRSATGISPYQEQVIRANQTATQWIAAYQKAGVPTDAVSMMRRWMDIGISCLPAFLLIDIVIVFVLSLVMFGRLKSWREFTTTRTKAAPGAYLFRNLSLPEWLLFAFVAGGLTPLVTGMLQKVVANILAVVVFLYLLQGLAIFRAMLAAAATGPASVIFGYAVLIFLTLTGIAPLLLAVTGLFDSFFDFRKFKRKDHTDEGHID